MPPTASADATRTESKLKHPEDHSSDTEDNDASRQTVGNNRPDEVHDKEEDPATQAASENLRQTTISDKEPSESIDTTVMSDVDQTSAKKEDEQPGNRMTPEAAVATDAQDEEMKERVSSPKKKRGREQDDEPRDAEAANDVEEVGSSPNGAAVNGGRTTRLEPEKKRHRDESVDAIAITEPILDAKAASSNESTNADMKTSSEPDHPQSPPETSTKSIFGSNLKDTPQLSSSAFAGSAFGSLAASSTSGFADLAASKPAVFGAGSKSPVSGFGALASAPPIIRDSSAVKLGFGSSVSSTSSPLSLNSGFSSSSAAGFGALGSGSTFGGGFGGFNSGAAAKLSSFAASGAPSGEKSSKAPKAFGAPESDEEEDEDEDEDETRGDADSDDESVSVDEKKKAKFSKGLTGLVALDDGEKEEATLLQFRTKMFVLDPEEKAWKERGVGTVKLNVPREFVELDLFFRPIPGTFDPSVGVKSDDDEKAGPPLARIIMRQEGTNKVILNSPIIKAQKFEEQNTNGNRILFTAFEDGKPVNVLLRMKDENVKSFISEIKCIQKEL